MEMASAQKLNGMEGLNPGIEIVLDQLHLSYADLKYSSGLSWLCKKNIYLYSRGEWNETIENLSLSHH